MSKEILVRLLEYMVKRRIVKKEAENYVFSNGQEITWEMLQYDKFNAIKQVLDTL